MGCLEDWLAGRPKELGDHCKGCIGFEDWFCRV